MLLSDRSRRRRLLFRTTVAIGAVAIAWIVAATVLFWYPRTDTPSPADAIVILGPSLPDRVAQAERVASDLNIHELVLSIGDTPGQIGHGLCAPDAAPPVVGMTVRCFVPDPYTTRGEAREIGALAQRHGWNDVLVIARKSQITRARLLIDRCFDGTVQILAAAGEDDEWDDYMSDVVYQSGALVKALAERGC